MIAVLSCTEDDRYLFALPITVWSWNKLGVQCLIFAPNSIANLEKFKVAKSYCRIDTLFYGFDCHKDAEASYAQCSRLFAASLPELPQNEVLITSDVDMVALDEYLKMNDGNVQVFGADLLAGMEQIPMCYVAAEVCQWWYFMKIGKRTYQECLDLAFKGDAVNKDMKGNIWSRDQEILSRMLRQTDLPITYHNRRGSGGFATRRVDRDDANWESNIANAVDYHIHRPSYTEPNLVRILTVLSNRYRDEDFRWIVEYRNKYIDESKKSKIPA